ncbi:asparagine synthetase B [Croceivirga lutea]|uniref:asparagine synthase (glutamine-hydrolyzing) n=1 Tax=Croceivirga lutea TaxID=1775167 RepID=UPI00163A5DA1|nr:asparagine synthase (glutamine-hydrolyzing) [Croceivirga lutea]GGG42619.1 asparagine synthetase B [Croceivirga lutea]
MCGINGLISSAAISKETISNHLEKMNNAIIHRGPDDDGVYVDSFKGNTFAMGMRRLSIIDLSTGKQPISNDDGSITIVFNGEIYNYKSLKKELQDLGVTFKTNSDTEVILRQYEAFGTASFSKLDGMFGFSIFDKNLGKIFIARDFFGEKPLYYTTHKNQFIWASELKSIVKILDKKPEVSKIGLNLFFRLTYVPAPHTIFEDIYKLPANSFISYDLATNTFETAQIEPEFNKSSVETNFESAKNKVRELVTESVVSRSVADVPLGTFLSGGVDSSIISLCLSKHKNEKINTFSIGFEKKEFDETDKSRVVADLINSNHHEFIVKEDDFKTDLHEILLNFDEPFSDTASLPTYLVAKKTRAHVKVALTGDGGDEVFGGYNKYYVGKINNKYISVVPKGIHNIIMKTVYPLLYTKDDRRDKRFAARKMLNTINYNGNYFWDIISLANTENQLQQLLKTNQVIPNVFSEYQEKLGFESPKTLTDFRFVDKIISLEGGMLPKVDRTSMLTSLECRAPLLNKKLWRYANGLPEDFLMKGWNKKYILKEAFKQDFPEGFLEKSKQGFETPVGDWLRKSLRKEMESYIAPSLLEKQGFFNENYITNLVNDHLNGKRDNSYMVWAFYCFQKWYCNTYDLSA